MKKAIIAVLLLSVAVFLSGCASSYSTAYVQPKSITAKKRHIAILPLVNNTSYPRAGQSVGDILTTELYATKRFTIMERTALKSAIRGNVSDLAQVIDKSVAIQAGKKLGVDTVVYGSVTEYRYKRGLDQSPAVGVNLRMVDVDTGTVMWASSMSKAGRCFFTCEDSLNRISQMVCRSMVEDMIDTLDNMD